MSRRTFRADDLPLLQWGETLRQRARERRQLHRRGGLIAGLIGAVLMSTVVPPAPRLVWNVSASAPRGLYLVSPGARYRRGDRVIARIPAAARTLASVRHYLPANVPLVKRIGAVPGDTVCATGASISIDGKIVATRRSQDGLGRAMPWWHGCHRLRQGDVFLLASRIPASFDGRYFGISQSADIVGTARLIWA